jgi:hypothetical protein
MAQQHFPANREIEMVLLALQVFQVLFPWIHDWIPLGRLHPVVRGNRELRVAEAPRELHRLHFLTAWHPRLDSDPRHVWLREAMRSTTDALTK